MLILYDTRELLTGRVIRLSPGDAGLGLHLKEDNQTISTEAGIPEHQVLGEGIVLFGLQRFLKQERKNSAVSMANQVYNFVLQNPEWYPKNVYRPIYDASIDDALALALLSREHRNHLLQTTEILSLLTELNEWAANRYNFVKRTPLRYLNSLLNSFPYPYYNVKQESQKTLCELILMDMETSLVEGIELLVPTRREYPKDLQFTVGYSNDKSALLEIKSQRYGSEELIVQEYFESNPEVARVIAVREVKNKPNRAVSIYNSNIYDETLSLYNYVNTKELNTEEKLKNGSTDWKNLKLQVLGPKRGSLLDNETIWKYSAIN
jgi:hypothetical protein